MFDGCMVGLEPVYKSKTEFDQLAFAECQLIAGQSFGVDGQSREEFRALFLSVELFRCQVYGSEVEPRPDVEPRFL